MKRISLIFAGVIVALLFSGANVQASHEQIAICCAWDDSLEDGELTYSISGGEALEQATVNTAVQAWATAVDGLTLSPPEPDEAADIEIKFKKGGGTVAGQALRQFNTNGFMRKVRISISGKAFGLVNEQDTVAEITRHEVGHALGLGHATFPDLMDPTVGGPAEISDCDVAGVVFANNWALGVGGGGSPVAPAAGEFNCGAGGPAIDIQISSVIASPDPIEQGDTLTITVTVSNQGTTDEEVIVTLVEDIDDATGATTPIALASGATVQIAFTWNTTGASLGEHLFTATHDLAPDGDPSNDIGVTTTQIIEAVEDDDSGGGPPPCKGPNRNDEGCNP